MSGNRFISSLEEWKNPNTWRISLQQLESLLNQNVNLSQGQKFDFLSDVPLSKNILDNLKKQERYGSNNPPSAFLLAEVDSRTSFSEDLSENIFSILPAFSNTLNTFGHVKVDSEV